MNPRQYPYISDPKSLVNRAPVNIMRRISNKPYNPEQKHDEIALKIAIIEEKCERILRK